LREEFLRQLGQTVNLQMESVRRKRNLHRWKHCMNAVKPILFYCKPPMVKPVWFVDLVKSPQRSKAFHNWGQSVTPVRYLVEHFTEPGALVFDPFTGGGTTALACVQCGREFIGCEIDARIADMARRRVSDVFYTPSLHGQMCLMGV